MDLREAALRQHRAISLFTMIQCWVRDLDGLEITRADLERMLDLQRLKDTRISWLETDFSEFFATASYDARSEVLSVRGHPQASVARNSQAQAKRQSDPAKKDSKSRIGNFILWGSPSERHMVSEFAGLSPLFDDSINFHERLLSAFLSLLAQGLISPQSLIGIGNDAAG